jgi:hypothetical protein
VGLNAGLAVAVEGRAGVAEAVVGGERGVCVALGEASPGLFIPLQEVNNKQVTKKILRIFSLLYKCRSQKGTLCEGDLPKATSRFLENFWSKGGCRAAKNQERRLATTLIGKMYGREKIFFI